jgi:hypothetical protein
LPQGADEMFADRDFREAKSRVVVDEGVTT